MLINQYIFDPVYCIRNRPALYLIAISGLGSIGLHTVKLHSFVFQQCKNIKKQFILKELKDNTRINLLWVVFLPGVIITMTPLLKCNKLLKFLSEKVNFTFSYLIMHIIIHFIIYWGQIVIICIRNSSQWVLIGPFPNRKMQFLVGRKGQWSRN